MKSCLVTGGAGFIGSHLVSALLQEKRLVRVLDDFSTGRRQNLEGLGNASGGGRLEIIEADIRDADKVAEAVQGIDVVFHEAAFVSAAESMERPQDCLDVNVTGTSTLLEAARKAGVRRAVIASSAAVYGDSDALPLAEQTSPRPLSPYAASKLVAETYAALYSNAFGLEVTALRYFNVYGPRQRPDSQYAAAVPIFIRQLLDKQPVTIYGDGGQTRDLIFVGDVVRANFVAADHAAAAGQVFNVCTGRAIRILDLLETLHELIPGGDRPAFSSKRPGDIYESLGNPHKAEAVLGFRAGVSLVEGLRKTVEWMQ